MMIGIDGNEANQEKRVGIGQYAFQLLKQLKADSVLKCNIYLKSPPLADLPKETKNWRYRIIGPQKLWTQFALPLHLFFDREKPDVFFSPSHYAPRFAPCRRVISIMDLSFLVFPELFTKKDLYQLRLWTAYSVQKAEKICTISEFSKSAICKEYHVDSQNVIVTYPGYDRINFQFPISNFQTKWKKIREKYGIKKNYILFVGTLQPRKNVIRLIEAFGRIKRSDLQLVIAGKKGWLYEDIFTKIKEMHMEEKIVFCEFPPNEELALLYGGARCFVLPSLYEGFGLPMVEAMACGCPVVVSNVSSLPEIAKDAAIYVNPYDIHSITQGLEKGAYNENMRQKLIQRGLSRVKEFSWDICAKKTLSILTDIIKT